MRKTRGCMYSTSLREGCKSLAQHEIKFTLSTFHKPILQLRQQSYRVWCEHRTITPDIHDQLPKPPQVSNTKELESKHDIMKLSHSILQTMTQIANGNTQDQRLGDLEPGQEVHYLVCSRLGVCDRCIVTDRH